MAARFKVTTNKPDDLINQIKSPFVKASVQALQQTAANIVIEGRANIAGAGAFGPKWQEGLQFRMKDIEGGLQAKAIIFHRFGIAGVFEHGATIAGNPLLWIPTTPKGPPPSRSGKKLVAAKVRGQPVLFDAADRDPHRKPLYIGVPSVRIPKKWRIFEIAQKHVQQIGQLFARFFAGH